MRSLFFLFASALLVGSAFIGTQTSPASTDSMRVLRVALDESAAASSLPPALLIAEPLFPGATDPRLTRWRRLDVSSAQIGAYIADLAAIPAVVDVSERPKAELAAVLEVPDGESCPITTPPYHLRQGYLAELEVEAAWARPGGRGAGIALADVEGEWNYKHEDLPTDRISHAAGTRMRVAGWRAHGTAVLGVVAAKENSIGMVGIAPDVDRIVTASMGRIGAARAIFEAQKRLNPGDVLIVELHGPGPNSGGQGQQGFVPMEYWQPEFDVIRAATDRGVIIVEAAGNGAENLDAAVYRKKFDRQHRDSGAILVGAGAPKTHARLGFSNFGARVDVQGWGRDVATLDYGDLQGCSTPGRKYTRLFAGTSSASPVVAGAAVVVQGALVGAGRPRLTPVAMREVLTATGTPQPNERTKIGPLPNVRRALAQVLDYSGKLLRRSACSDLEQGWHYQSQWTSERASLLHMSAERGLTTTWPLASMLGTPRSHDY